MDQAPHCKSLLHLRRSIFNSNARQIACMHSGCMRQCAASLLSPSGQPWHLWPPKRLNALSPGRFILRSKQQAELKAGAAANGGIGGNGGGGSVLPVKAWDEGGRPAPGVVPLIVAIIWVSSAALGTESPEHWSSMCHIVKLLHASAPTQLSAGDARSL